MLIFIWVSIKPYCWLKRWYSQSLVLCVDPMIRPSFLPTFPSSLHWDSLDTTSSIQGAWNIPLLYFSFLLMFKMTLISTSHVVFEWQLICLYHSALSLSHTYAHCTSFRGCTKSLAIGSSTHLTMMNPMPFLLTVFIQKAVDGQKGRAVVIIRNLKVSFVSGIRNGNLVSVVL